MPLMMPPMLMRATKIHRAPGKYFDLEELGPSTYLALLSRKTGQKGKWRASYGLVGELLGAPAVMNTP